MKIILQILIIFFPWKIRRFLLCKIFKFKIAKSAKIGKSVILADELIMEDFSKIGSLTICKNIDKLYLKNNTSLGSLNFITGFNTKKTNEYSHRKTRKCELILGRHSAITSRHFIDCNGGVYIGNFTTFAGIRSTLLTHSIDVYKNRQDVHPVVIGDYCFIGTGCIILGGAALPDYSVLGAGALLSKNFKEPNCLFGGVPAKFIKKIDKEEALYFKREVGFVK